MPCPHEVERVCQGRDGCGMIVGVAGLTEGQESSFRLKGFYQNNRLWMNTPIKTDHVLERQN